MDQNAEELARGVLRLFARWRPQVSADLAACAMRVLNEDDEDNHALQRLIDWAMNPTSVACTKTMARAAERLRVVLEQRAAVARRRKTIVQPIDLFDAESDVPDRPQ
jgi:hypothetical protein